jgi:hypothetical protein
VDEVLSKHARGSAVIGIFICGQVAMSLANPPFSSLSWSSQHQNLFLFSVLIKTMLNKIKDGKIGSISVSHEKTIYYG